MDSLQRYFHRYKLQKSIHRRCEPLRTMEVTYGSHLNYQQVFNTQFWTFPKVLNLSIPIISQQIESQTVFFFIYQFDELILENQELAVIKATLKDRILYTLPKIDTLLRDPPQTAFPCFCHRLYIISNQYKHQNSYFHMKDGYDS